MTAPDPVGRIILIPSHSAKFLIEGKTWSLARRFHQQIFGGKAEYLSG
jgi:hypothetical protein